VISDTGYETVGGPAGRRRHDCDLGGHGAVIRVCRGSGLPQLAITCLRRLTWRAHACVACDGHGAAEQHGGGKEQAREPGQGNQQGAGLVEGGGEDAVHEDPLSAIAGQEMRPSGRRSAQ
jgi:hypothetical protein